MQALIQSKGRTETRKQSEEQIQEYFTMYEDFDIVLV